MGFIIIVVLIGLIPAAIASSKGYNFLLWWFYGSALFIVALPHSLMLGPGGDKRRCPFCAEAIRAEAKICPHCQREIPEAPKKPCTRCKNDIPIDASTCPICGSNQADLTM